MANLVDLLLKSAKALGPKPFLVLPDREPVAFGELDALSARIATRLLNMAAPGDRILVQVEKSAEAVLLYLAALRAGLVYVPLNTQYTSRELAYFIADADPKIVVSSPGHADVFAQLLQGRDTMLLTLGEAAGGSLLAELGSEEASVTSRDDDDIACILYTSGTTGRSKGAMLTHANLSSNAKTLHEYWRWRDDDVLLHVLPIYHVHGLFVALHCALIAGATTLFHTKFDGARTCQDLPRSTVFMGVPTHYVRLLQTKALDRRTCSTMRLFTSGSAPLLASTHEQFASRTGHQILERYGMTETGMVLSNPYCGKRMAGTVGFPLPGIDIRIAGEGGDELPPNTKGILEVKGPNVFKGYWGREEKIAEAFRPDGYFQTGDIAEADSDGRITLHGRANDVIISGGLNIYPKEIEELIDAMPEIGESAVIGVPHHDFGELVIAVVTRSSSKWEVEEERILQNLQGRLARFKIPKKVLLVDALPRNAMGKVQKAQLRKDLHDRFAHCPRRLARIR